MNSINAKHPSHSKIICPGFGRTGTTSLAQALNMLGFRTEEVKGHWYLVKLVGRRLIYQPSYDIASEYSAYLDSPIPLIYQDLVNTYPNSLVILTHRPVDHWLKSMEHLQQRQSKWMFTFRNRHFRPLVEAYNTQVYGAPWFDRDVYACNYERHYSDVRAFFQSRREPVLEIDLSREPGWPPICEFLSKEIPETPFPRRNASLSK